MGATVSDFAAPRHSEAFIREHVVKAIQNTWKFRHDYIGARLTLRSLLRHYRRYRKERLG